MSLGFSQVLESEFRGKNWHTKGISFIPQTYQWGVCVHIFTHVYSFNWNIIYDHFTLNEPRQYFHQREAISKHVHDYLNEVWC